MLYRVVGLCMMLLMSYGPATAGEARTDSGNASAKPAELPQSTYGGAFILRDQNGKIVQDDGFRGKFLLLTFGYTRCPDICPTTLLDMSQALDLIGRQSDRVQPLFITLDPEHDTPQRLAEYVRSFHPRLIALTGPEPYVANAAKKYRIKFERIPDKGGGYSIDHAAAIFLMGPAGEFLFRFPYNTSPEEIAKRVRDAMAAAKE